MYSLLSYPVYWPPFYWRPIGRIGYVTSDLSCALSCHNHSLVPSPYFHFDFEWKWRLGAKPPLPAAAIPWPVGDWDHAGGCLCGQRGCVRDAVYELAVVSVNNRSAMLDNEYANQKLGFQIPKKSGFHGKECSSQTWALHKTQTKPTELHP